MARVSSSPTEQIERRVEALFVAHVESVFNVAYRIVWNRSDAEDVVQATFIKAFTRLDQVRDTSKTRSWLLQVAYREAIAVTRRRRDLPTDPDDMRHQVSSTPGPDDLAVAASVAAELSRALQRLEPQERVAVTLRDVEGLPMREVAEVLGLGLSAAKMRVHRGRNRLRTYLSESGVL